MIFKKSSKSPGIPTLLVISVLILLIVVVNALRFYRLDQVPHGYHVDEYAAAVSLQCLGKAGEGPFGNKNELFLQQGFGTPKPPNYTYPVLLWTKIFGYKVDALRMFSVLAILVGIAGLFLLGRLLGGPWVGLWSVVAATISPWSWVLGRLGWESFFAPVAVIWGLYFFFKNSNRWNDVWAAVCFCMAAYFYPPARIFLPFLIAFLLGFELFVRKQKHYWGLFFLVLIVPAIPLICAQLQGRLSYRINEVAIWNHDYLTSMATGNSALDFLKAFFINFSKHLDVNYLFLSGDPDLKHATQKVGLLSVLDILAWLTLAVGFIFYRLRSNGSNIWKSDGHWLVLFVLCFLASIVPAGLTFLGTPNSLRMCLGWPFLCLITGFSIAWLGQRYFLAASIITVIVVFYASFYLNDYFNGYIKRSEWMFSAAIDDEAKSLRDQEGWSKFLIENYDKDYRERYYLMNNLGQSCQDSFKAWKAILTYVCQKDSSLPRCEQSNL